MTRTVIAANRHSFDSREREVPQAAEFYTLRLELHGECALQDSRRGESPRLSHDHSTGVTPVQLRMSIAQCFHKQRLQDLDEINFRLDWDVLGSST